MDSVATSVHVQVVSLDESVRYSVRWVTMARGVKTISITALPLPVIMEEHVLKEMMTIPVPVHHYSPELIALLLMTALLMTVLMEEPVLIIPLADSSVSVVPPTGEEAIVS